MNLDCGTLNSEQAARLEFREHPGIMKTIHLKNRNQPLPARSQAIDCGSFLVRLRGLKSSKSGIRWSSNMHARIRLCILSILLMIQVIPASAQTPTPAPGPIYIVQEDDNSLWEIASRFNVSLADIVAINNITNPDIIFPFSDPF